MVTEDYVSFETAKLLKEKGFDEPCYKSYNYEGCLCNGFTYGPHAPTLQMAMKWLREEKGIQIEISIVGTDTWESPMKWVYGFRCQTKDIIDRRHVDFSTYEQACEAAIKYCLEKLI